MLRTECLRGTSIPPDQQRWSPFHAEVKVDCWSSLCRSSIPWIIRGNHLFTKSGSWLLILSVLIIDLPPPSESTEARLPFHMKVKVDFILSVSIVDPSQSTEVITFSHEHWSWLLILSVNCQSPLDQQRQSPFHTKVKVNCWSSLSIIDPLRSTEAITFSCKSGSWLLILSVSIVGLPPPPGSTAARSPFHMKVKIDLLQQ